MLDLLVTAISSPSLKYCSFKQSVASLPEVLLYWGGQITGQQSPWKSVFWGKKHQNLMKLGLGQISCSLGFFYE